MRIMVAGDDIVLREALIELLAAEETLEIVGQAGTTAVHLMTGSRPDLVILDEGTGDQAGATVRAIRNAVPRARVIVLTARADSRGLGSVLLAGADAVLGPDAGKEELFAIVRGRAHSSRDHPWQTGRHHRVIRSGGGARPGFRRGRAGTPGWR